jgi:hypothetical protein
MERLRKVGSTLGALLIASFICPAQTDTVKDYAGFCYAQIGIAATDLPATFACSAGDLITTFANGTAFKDLPPADPNRSGTNHLKACDTPAWLGSGISGKQCYDATYIRSLSIAANKDFQGALLCRHKIRDSSNQTDFDDIALILHNKKTGNTCWFNTIDGERPVSSGTGIMEMGDTTAGTNSVKNLTAPGTGVLQVGVGVSGPGIPTSTVLVSIDSPTAVTLSKNSTLTKAANTITFNTIASVDGRTVPRPDTDAAGFWLKPSSVAAIRCAQCHDDGPWMVSQWLDSQGFAPVNKKGTKYITPVYMVPAVPPAPAKKIFDWPATDNFVTIAKAGLLDGSNPAFTAAEKTAQKALPTCTGCHKLSGKVVWGTATNFTYSTAKASDPPFRGWFNFTIGKSTPTQAGTTTAMDYAHTRWMPPSGGRPGQIPPSPTPEATYDKLYMKYLAELRTCMGVKPADRTPPCGTQTLAFNSAPGGGGATVSATDTGTNQLYMASAVPLAGAPIPTPVSIAPGTSLQLGWQADSTFYACITEATIPAGVLVPSTLGEIGTGANWPLPQSPPRVGPLTEPGIYDFSIYCDNTYTASLQFQISGQPAPMLRLATVVQSDTQAIAIDSKSVQQLATRTDVLVNNPAVLTWTAYNVMTDCALNGPGLMVPGDVGTTQVTVPGPADQVYTFSCTGLDGLLHSVSSTLHPITSGVCGINPVALGKAGVPNESGNIQLYWTDTSGNSSFPVAHYNIYRSENSDFDPFLQIAGADADPSIPAPQITTPAGGTVEFTDASAVTGVTYYYRIAPAGADDTEFCSSQAIPTLTAIVPVPRR